MTVRDFVTWENGKYKRRVSSSETIDFLSIKVGASALEIKETTGHFDFSGYKLTNIADPTAANHAASKSYVDSVAAGLDPKEAVRLATIAALPDTPVYNNGTSGVGATLTAGANGALSVDGVAVALNDRILVKDESTQAHNGIYVVTATGDASNPYVLTRSADFDGAPTNEVDGGEYFFVKAGGVNADCGFVVSSPNTTATIGTTAIVFTQFSSAGVIEAGAGMTKTGNTLNVIAADNSLTVNADSIQVKLDAAGAVIVGANGLKVSLEASDPSLQISGNELGIKTGHGITKDSTGTTVKLDGTTLAKGADGLKVAAGGITATELASSVAGNGLTGGAGTALAVGAGDAISVAADAVAVDFTKSMTISEGTGVAARDVVYITNTGTVQLALATGNVANTELGVMFEAGADTESKKVWIRRGAIIPGFSGLTPGAIQYISRTTGGALTEALTGFVAGEHVYKVGKALSATELIFDPEYMIEY